MSQAASFCRVFFFFLFFAPLESLQFAKDGGRKQFRAGGAREDRGASFALIVLMTGRRGFEIAWEGGLSADTRGWMGGEQNEKEEEKNKQGNKSIVPRMLRSCICLFVYGVGCLVRGSVICLGR